MNINDPVDPPHLVKTRSDALAMIATHRVGALVYQVDPHQNSITKHLVRAIQITVGANGNVDVRYHCTHPDLPGKTGNWITDASTVYATAELAMQAIWSPVMSKVDRMLSEL